MKNEALSYKNIEKRGTPVGQFISQNCKNRGTSPVFIGSELRRHVSMSPLDRFGVFNLFE